MTDFTTVPSSLTVAVGEEAVFQCRYPGAIGTIWSIFGTAVVSSPSITVTPDTLTITAQPEYNETIVVCSALLQDFSVQHAPPVLLLVNFSSKPKESNIIIIL